MGQGRHCDAATRPTCVLQRLTGQGEQLALVTPVWSEYEPAGHGVQASTLLPPMVIL